MDPSLSRLNGHHHAPNTEDTIAANIRGHLAYLKNLIREYPALQNSPYTERSNAHAHTLIRTLAIPCPATRAHALAELNTTLLSDIEAAEADLLRFSAEALKTPPPSQTHNALKEKINTIDTLFETTHPGKRTRKLYQRAVSELSKPDPDLDSINPLLDKLIEELKRPSLAHLWFQFKLHILIFLLLPEEDWPKAAAHLRRHAAQEKYPPNARKTLTLAANHLQCRAKSSHS